MLIIASLPIVITGLTIGLMNGLQLDGDRLFQGVIRAPLIEESLWRGLLIAAAGAVLIPARKTPLAFWLLAIASSLTFGGWHIAWTGDALVTGWPTVLVTTIGGIWFAWLMQRWNTLLIPIILHATMNLGWELAAQSGGAGGGGLTMNLARAATIAMATWWTIRAAPA